MRITSVVRALIEAKATPEMILAAVEAIERTDISELEQRKKSDRERQTKRRAKNQSMSRDVTLQPVTSCDISLPSLSPLFPPQTPPISPTNPSNPLSERAHTQSFEDLNFEGEYVQIAKAEGLVGEVAERCWKKWKLKRAINPPANPLEDFGIWVLNEFKPKPSVEPTEKPPDLTEHERLIQRLGLANWKRRQKMFLESTARAELEAYEKINSTVTWNNLEEWRNAS